MYVPVCSDYFRGERLSSLFKMQWLFINFLIIIGLNGQATRWLRRFAVNRLRLQNHCGLATWNATPKSVGSERKDRKGRVCSGMPVVEAFHWKVHRVESETLSQSRIAESEIAVVEWQIMINYESHRNPQESSGSLSPTIRTECRCDLNF